MLLLNYSLNVKLSHFIGSIKNRILLNPYFTRPVLVLKPRMGNYKNLGNFNLKWCKFNRKGGKLMGWSTTVFILWKV